MRNLIHAQGCMSAVALPKIVRRINPFDKPLLAYVRDFQTGKLASLVQVPSSVFGTSVRQDIIQRVVVWHRAGLRAGTASTKDRSQVSGTRRKAAPQKGRGEARIGTLRAPHRRGGGVCFGPKPRDWSFPLSQQVRDLGLRSALSAKFAENKMHFIFDHSIHAKCHRTSRFASILELNSLSEQKVLFLDTDRPSDKTLLASRNIPGIRFASLKEEEPLINAYNILEYNHIVVTMRAAKYLEKHLQPK